MGVHGGSASLVLAPCFHTLHIMVMKLLVLFALLATASATPMRIIVGGKTAATTPAPTRISTAGKRIPPFHLQRLRGNEEHRPPGESSRQAATKAKMRSLAALTDAGGSLSSHSGSDSDKDASYRPTTSESSQASQSSVSSADDAPKGSAKRQKTSGLTFAAGMGGQSLMVMKEATASDATSSKPSPLISPTLAMAKAGRPRTRDDSDEKVQRERLLDLNSHRRRAGKAAVPVELPPSRPTLESRQQRIDVAQRIIDRYNEGLRALRQKKFADMRANIRMGKARREDPLVKEEYQRKMAEHQHAMERFRNDERRTLRRARVMVSREKKRQAEEKPLRGVGRPRVPDPTPRQVSIREAVHRWHVRRLQGEVAGQESLQRGQSVVEQGANAEYDNEEGESSRVGVGLGQIRWTGRRRDSRVRQQVGNGQVQTSVTPIVTRKRRPRAPIPTDPALQRKRAMERNRIAALYDRPLEPVPPKPAHRNNMPTASPSNAAPRARESAM